MSELASKKGVEAAENDAARWAMRCAAGLTPAEESALQAWLAGDPTHATLLDEYCGAWNRFSPLAEVSGPRPLKSSERDAKRDAPGRTRLLRLVVPALAVAAAIAIMLTWRTRPESPTSDAGHMPSVVSLPLPCELRTLADGTQVELNRGAEIALAFTPTERRITLIRGEASFAVVKDPARPFIVSADGVEARAVGTAFNVRRSSGVIEVVVTEGVVRVDGAPKTPESDATPVLLSASQQITVSSSAAVARAAVTTLNAQQLAQQTAWQPRELDFDDAPLHEIVAAFNRHNPVSLRIVSPALAAERVTAKFRSDNVESFVRLLERVYQVRVTLHGDGVDLSR